jgi:HEAT repeat protein
MNISDLINILSGKDSRARGRARDQLVEIGRPAVPELRPLLLDKRTYVRWEAAKAMSDIADPGTAPDLVELLGDNDPGIRWMAAEGLIRLEQAGLRPLLEALLERADSVRLREGADHVLKVLARNEVLPAEVGPVLEALHGPQPAIGAREAAKVALDS